MTLITIMSFVEAKSAPALLILLLLRFVLHGQAALAALQEYPGGMHLGGGVTPATAKKYLDAGASHVIVTSYVFQNGQVLLHTNYILIQQHCVQVGMCSLCMFSVPLSVVALPNHACYWQSISR
jgi:hypothetical protein